MRHFAALQRSADFTRLRRRGRRTATPHLTVYHASGAPDDARPLVGITVSKAVGGAVERNRLRRRLAASLHELLNPHDRLRVLVVPRPSAAALDYAQLRDELRMALV